MDIFILNLLVRQRFFNDGFGYKVQKWEIEKKYYKKQHVVIQFVMYAF